MLRDYNQRLGAPGATLEAIERLARSGSLVVIGGQQPGVLTGPLYTFWKAQAVIGLAETLSGLGPAVVPVFWIGAEDHDLGEVAPVSVLTPDGRVETRTYDPGKDYPPRTSVGHLPAGTAAATLVDEVEDLLWPSEFRSDVVGLLKDAARAADNLGDWFGRLLLQLFGQRGLVVANPLLPGLRRLQAPILERMVEDNQALAEAFQAGRQRVLDLGFTPQVDKDPDAANLYLYHGLERVPLFRDPAGGFSLGRDGRGRLSAGELLDTARTAPERLSTNVVFRPAAQDQVFPVLAYVGGPGETSYYGLYRDVYHRLRRPMPVIYPRPNVTVLEPAVVRHLRRCGLDPAEALDGDHLERRRAAYLETADPVGIDRLFDRAIGTLRRLYQEPGGVTAGLRAIDPALDGLAGQNLAKVTEEMEWLRKKAWQKHRQNCQDAVARFDSIAVALRPRGDLQERVYNIFPLLAKYGPGLARQLLDLRLVPDDGRTDPGHRLVTI